MSASLLWYAAAAAAALAVAHAITRVHAIHALLLPSSRCLPSRSDTRHQTLFPSLRRFFDLPSRFTPYSPSSSIPSPHSTVTLKFGRDTPDDVVITAPPHSSALNRVGSAWATPRVRHASAAMCRRLNIESGRWIIGDFYGGGRPTEAEAELPGSWLAIAVSKPLVEDCLNINDVVNQVRRYGSLAAQQLDHQLASAALDAELYLHLCTTPVWLRLLHAALGTVSLDAADLMVTRLLRVQMRAMLHAHDTAEYRGFCKALRILYPLSMTPPDWVLEFERWSEAAASRWWLGFNSWLARRVLGMQAEYVEYRLEVPDKGKESKS